MRSTWWFNVRLGPEVKKGDGPSALAMGTSGQPAPVQAAGPQVGTPSPPAAAPLPYSSPPVQLPAELLGDSTGMRGEGCWRDRGGFNVGIFMSWLNKAFVRYHSF